MRIAYSTETMIPNLKNNRNALLLEPLYSEGDKFARSFAFQMKGCNSLNVFDVFFTNIVDFVVELFFQNQFPMFPHSLEKKRHGKKCIQIRLAKTGCGALLMSNQG